MISHTLFYDYVNSCASDQLSVVSCEMRTLFLIEKLQSPEFLFFLYFVLYPARRRVERYPNIREN